MHRVVVAWLTREHRQARDLGGLRDRIKNIVTAPTLVVRPKYRDETVAPNYINLVITTNEALGAIALDAADRRFVCFRCAPPPPPSYFQRLCALLSAEEAPRAVHDWLMARAQQLQLQLRERRPRTAFYALCVHQSISPLARFISAVVNARAYRSGCDANGMVRVGQLYHDYTQYVADMRLLLPHKEARPAFTGALALLFPGDSALMKRVFAGGSAYVLHYEPMRAVLRAAGEYDPHAAFDGLVQPGPSAWQAQDVARFRPRAKTTTA